MKAYLPDVVLLVCGLPMMGLLLYLGALSEGWLPPLCYLGAAVIFTGWHRTLINLCWRLSGKDPDDFDFHFPG